MLIIDITHGQGGTEKEIGYSPDASIDIVKAKRPTVQASFTHLPFRDGSAELIIFDPPHQVYRSREGAWMTESFGTFAGRADAERQLRLVFSECRRVLCPTGSLLLKWGTNHKPLRWILSLCEAEWEHQILVERPSCSACPSKPFSHCATVYWVELWSR